jgi:hypothetical protein
MADGAVNIEEPHGREEAWKDPSVIEAAHIRETR